MAVLLPLAAVALIRAVPSLQATTLPWVAPAITGAAAIIAGLALLVAVAATLEEGRIRDLADVAGLGMLATALAVVALDAAGSLSLGIGVISAAAAFVLGSLAQRRAVATRRGRAVALVIVFVLVEAGLAVILVATGWSVPDRMAPALLTSAALLLAVAAASSLDEPGRATALGIAAASAGALALGGPSGNEGLVAVSGMALAAVVLGGRLLARRLRTAPVTASVTAPFAAPAPALPELTTAPAGEPEYDELSRITRELRATLDDLVAARHLIELQRVEIDRVSSTDPLTGLASRWPTLERLRVEAAEARRYTHPVAVVLLDIDDFAQLNHEHGLDAGDAILREIALRLRIRMREADAVGRIGADAFLAILPHTDEGGTATFATAVLDRLLERRIVTERGEITVSLSIGIALMRPGMTLSGEDLLAAAEEALASARAAGGNRIAFDRLHGLARLDGERATGTSPDDVAEGKR